MCAVSTEYLPFNVKMSGCFLIAKITRSHKNLIDDNNIQRDEVCLLHALSKMAVVPCWQQRGQQM